MNQTEEQSEQEQEAEMLAVDDCVEAAVAKAAPRKKKYAPVIYSETEKLEHALKLAEARTKAACRGNALLLEELQYIVTLLAEATGMQNYQVMQAIRERTLTVTHEE